MSAPAVVRERPILFSGPMVRAILDGRKTMTRRVVMVRRCGVLVPALRFDPAPDLARCPYGAPGDRLWLREGIRFVGAGPMGDLSEYEADGTLTKAEGWPWKRNRLPSMLMPRGFSRLTLEITDIRVERVQAISAEDCMAEGLTTTLREHDAVCDLRDQFRALWDTLNAARGAVWGANPWAWVITFRRVEVQP